MAISYHPQISLKHFGPPESLREQGSVEVFSVRLWSKGAQVSPLINLPRRALVHAEVELGCASWKEFEAKVVHVSVRVAWIDERDVIRKAWRKLVRRYERMLEDTDRNQPEVP